MKLWQKGNTSRKEVEIFTVGKDREFDLQLAPYDILGSIAHVTMLAATGLITPEEGCLLVQELKEIYATTQDGTFRINDDIEDVHSQVEFLLTEKLGSTGKKIHAARSRNDQVLVDLKLYLRSETEQAATAVKKLFEVFIQKSEQHKAHLLPGYTHLQMAMPSSFGLWLGAYAESLADDLAVMKSAYDIINKNPLGSAAGYGSSFPINRRMTTQLLGFADLHYNVVYAQMSRGKTERMAATALAAVADTLARFSMDACLYLSPNFGFIHFPAEYTTGSSIMPHKKNPDVFELVRGHCNRLKALPNEISLMTTNLPSGYHRDLQLLKEHLFPAFTILHDCIDMLVLMLQHMEVAENILQDEKYKYLFSVEEVNKLVLQGIPFRDAYKQVGLAIEAGTFTCTPDIKHTHEGSIGRLCNDRIRDNMQSVWNSFSFGEYHRAIEQLLA